MAAFQLDPKRNTLTRYIPVIYEILTKIIQKVTYLVRKLYAVRSHCDNSYILALTEAIRDIVLTLIANWKKLKEFRLFP